MDLNGWCGLTPLPRSRWVTAGSRPWPHSGSQWVVWAHAFATQPVGDCGLTPVAAQWISMGGVGSRLCHAAFDRGALKYTYRAYISTRVLLTWGSRLGCSQIHIPCIHLDRGALDLGLSTGVLSNAHTPTGPRCLKLSETNLMHSLDGDSLFCSFCPRVTGKAEDHCHPRRPITLRNRFFPVYAVSQTRQVRHIAAIITPTVHTCIIIAHTDTVIHV